MGIRIIQLTDLHLYQDRESRLAGVRTWETFGAVLETVRRKEPGFDYLVLTGDLAQDESFETYAMLREALGDWVGRCRIIPGNHDDPARLREVFPDAWSQGEGPLGFSLQAGGWRVIGLDSHLPGEVNGRVDSNQIDWLEAELASDPALLALIFVHYPPIPINVAWIDELGLKECGEFVALVESSPQVKVVCAGHVHQEFAGRIGRAAFYTTPSTCVQFSARAEKAFDTKMAGYRTFTLERDSFRTEVVRLPGRGA